MSTSSSVEVDRSRGVPGRGQAWDAASIFLFSVFFGLAALNRSIFAEFRYRDPTLANAFVSNAGRLLSDCLDDHISFKRP
jgi:hypothetical protein